MLPVQSIFTSSQFCSQFLFLITVTLFAVIFGLNDVQTGQLGQAINTIWSGLFFYIGWNMMPSKPAANVLSDDKKSIFIQSFIKVYQTIKQINHYYKNSLRWFFLVVIFAEAAATAFTVVSVVFLADYLKLSGTQIGYFFITTLIASLPGTFLGAYITKKTNPIISWKLSMLFLAIVATIGAFTLTNDKLPFTYIWGIFIGILLGWFYPTEGLQFSLLLPKGQEAELGGFYVYCTQILGWLPPLIFTVLVESGIDQRYGVLTVQSFFLIAIFFASMMAPWDECIREVNAKITEVDLTHNQPRNDSDGNVI